MMLVIKESSLCWCNNHNATFLHLMMVCELLVIRIILMSHCLRHTFLHHACEQGLTQVMISLSVMERQLQRSATANYR